MKPIATTKKFGREYSRCFSLARCTLLHPSSSKSVSGKKKKKQNRRATVSTETSCFSPSQLLFLPIVQVLLADSCDENLINFNKLLWGKKTNRYVGCLRRWAGEECASTSIVVILSGKREALAQGNQRVYADKLISTN